MSALPLLAVALLLACQGAPGPEATATPATAPNVPTVAAKATYQRMPTELTFPATTELRVAHVDPDGELLIAPTLRAPKSFGTTQLTPGIHLLKLRRDGTVRWSHELAKNAEGFVSAMEVDSAGRIYIAGTFARTLKAGETSRKSEGDMDAFVASFDANGTHRWVDSLGGRAREVAVTLAIDEESGVLAFGGWAESTFVLHGTTYAGPSVAKDGFVARYSLNGEAIWARRFVGRGDNRVRAVALDQDSVVVLGNFMDRVELGSQIAQTKGEMDMFCARFHADGELDWSHTWGGDKWDEAAAMRVDDDGTITLAGSSSSDLQLTTELLPARGRLDLLIWQLSRDGDSIGSIRVGGSGEDVAMELSQEGPLHLFGYHRGDTNLGFGDIRGDENPQAILVELDGRLRVSHTERPPFERLFLTQGRDMILGQTANGLTLRY